MRRNNSQQQSPKIEQKLLGVFFSGYESWRVKLSIPKAYRAQHDEKTLLYKTFKTKKEAAEFFKGHYYKFHGGPNGHKLNEHGWILTETKKSVQPDANSKKLLGVFFSKSGTWTVKLKMPKAYRAQHDSQKFLNKTFPTKKEAAEFVKGHYYKFYGGPNGHKLNEHGWILTETEKSVQPDVGNKKLTSTKHPRDSEKEPQNKARRLNKNNALPLSDAGIFNSKKTIFELHAQSLESSKYGSSTLGNTNALNRSEGYEKGSLNYYTMPDGAKLDLPHLGVISASNRGSLPSQENTESSLPNKPSAPNLFKNIFTHHTPEKNPDSAVQTKKIS